MIAHGKHHRVPLLTSLEHETRRRPCFPGGAGFRNAVLERVLDEVDQRLNNKLAIDASQKTGIAGAFQRAARIFDNRLVQFHHLSHEGGQVDLFKARVGGSGFKPGNAQKRVKGPDQSVTVLQRTRERIGGGRVFRRGTQRLLDTIAHSRERGLQIVGNVVRHILETVKQSLDAVQHEIEPDGEPVELVAGAVDRQTLGQVPRHDAPAGRRHGVNAPQHPATHEDKRDDAEDRDDDKPEAHCLRKQRAEMQLFLQVATDKQAKAAGELEDPHHCLAPCAAAYGNVAYALKLPGAAGENAFIQALDVSGQLVGGKVHHEIEAGAGPARSRIHRCHEAANA